MTARALVTGASRGIGAAIAADLAGRGHRIAVHAGRDADAARRVCEGLPGDGHAVVLGDLSDGAACERVVADTVAALGDLDVVVNNAGIFEAHAIDEVDYAAWRSAFRRTLAVDLEGPANLMWLAVDHWTRRAQGPSGARLVSVGSCGAYRGEPTTPAYGAAKAGLHALTQSLAVRLAPHGILCVAVAPGFVQTEMAREVLDGPGGDAVRAQSPFGRVAAVDEIARTVGWLACDAPLWLSGAIVDANGASYLR